MTIHGSGAIFFNCFGRMLFSNDWEYRLRRLKCDALFMCRSKFGETYLQKYRVDLLKFDCDCLRCTLQHPRSLQYHHTFLRYQTRQKTLPLTCII